MTPQLTIQILSIVLLGMAFAGCILQFLPNYKIKKWIDKQPEIIEFHFARKNMKWEGHSLIKSGSKTVKVKVVGTTYYDCAAELIAETIQRKKDLDNESISNVHSAYNIEK